MPSTTTVLLGFYLLSKLSGTDSIVCYGCLENMDPLGRCLNKTKDTEASCLNAITTCVISTGVRQKANSTKLEPYMTRRCSLHTEQSKDWDDFGMYASSKRPLVCRLLNRPQPYGLVDRRCICAFDSCNYMQWNDLMVYPVMSENYTGEAAGVVPSLGDNSLERLFAATIPPPILLVNETDQKNVEGNGSGGTTGTSTTLRTTTYRVETTTNSTAAEGGGSNAGLIAGLAVGGITIAGLAGAAVWWFKFRKSTKKSNKRAK